MTQLSPGIHRIESVLGQRLLAQYLIRDERSLLVDTGIASTPAGVLFEFLDGLHPDFVLLSHADVDHFGGTSAIKAAFPEATVLAHSADVPLMESSERILRERYGWYSRHGLSYTPETWRWFESNLGSAFSVDISLQGGERIRLGDNLCLEVLHLPGHTPGHLGLWEPSSRTAIVLDAVMGRGLPDLDGKVVHPSPYFDVDAYLASVEAIRVLRPSRLLTSHFAVMEGADVERFLADTCAFVEDVARLTESELADKGSLTLSDLLARADTALGPFTSMPNELAGPLRAHLRRLVADGRAREEDDGLRWSTVGAGET